MSWLLNERDEERAMRSGVLWPSALFIALLVSILDANAQGTIRGTVTDPANAVIPGVLVEASHANSVVTYNAETDDQGFYHFVQILAGQYTLTYKKQGFMKNVKTNIVLPYGQTIEVNKKMELASVSQTIMVEAGEPSLVQRTTDIQTIVDSRTLTDLPLALRTVPFVQLVPGTLSAEAGAIIQGGTSISVAGARTGSNNYSLDGVDNNISDPVGNQVMRLPSNVVDEVSLRSHKEAGFGRNSGATIQLSSRRGTNDFHGSARYINRNRHLSARQFFEDRRARLLRHQFSGDFEGRLVRDKTFFSAGYEGTREIRSHVRLASVPSPNRLAAARSILVLRGLPENSLSTQLLQLSPTANRSGDFNNLLVGAVLLSNGDSFLLRLDHTLSSANSLFARVNASRNDELFPSSRSFLAGYRTDSRERGEAVAAAYVFSSGGRANEFRFGLVRSRGGFFPEDGSFDPASVGLNTGVSDPQRFGLPFLKVTGFDALGSPPSLPFRQNELSWQVADNYSQSLGKQTLKAGIDFRRITITLRSDSGTRGRIVFDGSILGDPLADFLSGMPSGNTGIVRGNTARKIAANSIGLFLQDDVRFSRHLVVNIGLRYELNGVIKESEDRLSNFFPNQGGLLEVGSPALEKLYKNDTNNLAPRVGLAWDPIGTEKFIIRSSWGISFDAPSLVGFVRLGPFSNSMNPGSATNPGGTEPVFPLTPVPPIPFGPGVPIFGSPTTPIPPFDVFAVERNLETPYLQAFFLGFQYEFVHGSLIEVNYVGSLGSHLLRLIDLNQPSPGNSTTRNGRRPFFPQFPEFASVNSLVSAAKSNYHALVVTWRRRYSKGLAFDFTWTFSKSIDDASNPRDLPQDSRNLRKERALSDFDTRHRLVLSGLYELPFGRGKRFASNVSPWVNRLIGGWQLSSVVTLASGTHVTPFVSFDLSGTGTFADRPDQVGDPRPTGNRTQFINRNAFRIPTLGTFGTAGRNPVAGPRLDVWNFSALKTTPITERLNVEIRTEFFNFLNHPNFVLSNLAFDEPAFGTASTTQLEGGRREIQLGARIRF